MTGFLLRGDKNADRQERNEDRRRGWPSASQGERPQQK